ncbi:MAG: hypothetical protein ABGX32_06635 [Methylococcales bacterium]|jgi:hypothetical protein
MSLPINKLSTTIPISYRFFNNNQQYQGICTTLTDNKLIFNTDSTIQTGWALEVTLSPQQLSDVSFTALIEVESSTRIDHQHFEISAIINTIKAH